MKYFYSVTGNLFIFYSGTNEERTNECLNVYLLHFTIRTDGTYFFCVYIVTRTAKRYFLHLPINFVEGACFFTPVHHQRSVRSTEIELGCYVHCGFFWWHYVMCLLFHGGGGVYCTECMSS